MKCPFCSEEIQNEAKKCKHCGEWLDNSFKSNTAKKRLDSKNNFENPPEIKAVPYECYLVNKTGQWVQTVQILGKTKEDLAASVRKQYGPELTLHPDKNPVKVSDLPSPWEKKNVKEEKERGGCAWIFIIAGGIILAILVLSFM